MQQDYLMSNEIFSSMPLHGITLIKDRRVKVGNFHPDKKTGKFYRVNPDTVKRMNVAIAMRNGGWNDTIRDYYAVKLALNPPFVLTRGVSVGKVAA